MSNRYAYQSLLNKVTEEIKDNFNSEMYKTQNERNSKAKEIVTKYVRKMFNEDYKVNSVVKRATANAKTLNQINHDIHEKIRYNDNNGRLKNLYNPLRLGYLDIGGKDQTLEDTIMLLNECIIDVLHYENWQSKITPEDLPDELKEAYELFRNNSEEFSKERVDDFQKMIKQIRGIIKSAESVNDAIGILKSRGIVTTKFEKAYEDVKLQEKEEKEKKKSKSNSKTNVTIESLTHNTGRFTITDLNL